jgi:hypothetical protein
LIIIGKLGGQLTRWERKMKKHPASLRFEFGAYGSWNYGQLKCLNSRR